MGFILYGNDDSPVVPLMLYMPAKIGYIITSYFIIALLLTAYNLLNEASSLFSCRSFSRHNLGFLWI